MMSPLNLVCVLCKDHSYVTSAPRLLATFDQCLWGSIIPKTFRTSFIDGPADPAADGDGRRGGEEQPAAGRGALQVGLNGHNTESFD